MAVRTVLVCLALGACSLVSAGVTRVEVTERSDVLDGRPFGDAGPYERLTGRVFYAVDPAHRSNSGIADLALAARNDQGLVEFSAGFYLLRPKTPKAGNRTVLYHVVNRGRKSPLLASNATRSQDPRLAEHFGDGFMLRQGYTILWSGWQTDVSRTGGRLGLMAPKAIEGRRPVVGPVRVDFVPREETTSFPAAATGHEPIPMARDVVSRAVLTVRDGNVGSRRQIPSDEWHIEDGLRVVMPSGFKPGRIYELVYNGSGSRVSGLGYAAVRDLLSALKSGHGAIEPLVEGRKLDRAYGFGVSQSAMFLRSFLYRGFNSDEQGSQVFDAIFAITAGARSVRLNVRFAQPGRTAGPFRNFFFPSDLYPHSGLPQSDRETGLTEGLLDRAVADEVVPKIFFANSAYEYYGCAAALIHSSLDGKNELALHDNVRVYLFSGARHGNGSLPPERGQGKHLANPIDKRMHLRALLVAMDRWARGDASPPESRRPRIDRDELVTIGRLQFPAIPGVSLPQRVHQARRVDFGQEFRSLGRVSFEPPRVGKPFAALVPQVDSDGNDLAGIRAPEIEVPLATYTGWNFRSQEIGAPSELLDGGGSFFPFARTRKEREATGDPRPSIEERYAEKKDYLRRFRHAVDKLIEQGLLLMEDRSAAIERGEALWKLVVDETDVAVL